MAFFKVLETSFIGHSLAAAGSIVEINDDPTTGGMQPGVNLAACDAEGNMAAAEAAKPKTKTKAVKAVVEDTGADLA